MRARDADRRVTRSAHVETVDPGELEGDGRLSFADLSERVGLSKSPCWSRVRDLEADGVIGGYHARISPAALGLAVQCYADVRIKFDGHAAFEAAALAHYLWIVVVASVLAWFTRGWSVAPTQPAAAAARN